MNKKHLSFKELALISSMLFGMFFGAGNLIFPVFMGQQAGRNVWLASLGFLITGVGLPLIGVAALGMSQSDGLFSLSSKVSKGYGRFFTCLLCLTIGPLFAIPRCATVPFTTGVAPMLSGGTRLPLFVFSLVFFAIVLWFSLRPTNILTWIGKILNPIFLVLLAVLIVTALVSPAGQISSVEPQGAYLSSAFSTGFLEGYNTMDALACLVFGIIIVNAIRKFGIEKPRDIAANTVLSGISSCILMALIYMAIMVVGTQASNSIPLCANGGEVLNLIAKMYFGKSGELILALIATFACLTTAVGLVTSCAEIFNELFPKHMSYKLWAVTICGVSLLLANLGLNLIIAYSLPVLMFLYPLAITLMLLALFGPLYKNDSAVYKSVTAFTIAAAIFDFLKALPENARELFHTDGLVAAVSRFLPFYDTGFGWVCPAGVGLVIGIVIHISRREKA